MKNIQDGGDDQSTKDNGSGLSFSPSPSSTSISCSNSVTTSKSAVAEHGPTSCNPRQSIITPYKDDKDNCFEAAQNGFLEGVQLQNSHSHSHSHKRGATSKTIFSSNTHIHSSNNHHQHHDRNSSDSSAEDLHNRRMAMMMASPPLPPRNNSSREKQRRRARSSSRRLSGSGSGSSCSSLSQSLLLEDDSYKKELNYIRSPIAVRRRSSKESGSVPRQSSSHTKNKPTVSSFDGYPIDNKHERHRHYHRHHFGTDYSSPELSSESSPDSSPSRLVADIHRLQRQRQHQVSLQEQHSTSGRLSLSNKSTPACGHDSPSSVACIGSPIYSSSFSTVSSSCTSTSLLSTKLNINKTTMGVKSWCLSGTFMSMVILSLSGMVFLTNRAVIPSTGLYELEKEQLVPVVHNRPDHNTSAAGLRGKMVLGRMWDNSNASEKQPRSTDNKGGRDDNSGGSGSGSGSSSSSSSNNKARSVGKNDVSSKKYQRDKHISSSTGNDERPKQHQSKKKKKNTKVTVPSHRLQMHMPHSISNLGPKFEMVDPNIYYPLSNFQNDINKVHNSSTSLSSSLSTTYKLQQQQPKNVHYPRIVSLDPSVKRVKRKIKVYPADFTDNTQLYGTLPSDDERLSRMEMKPPYSTGECVPMQEWQTMYHPSCNAMHELALQTIGATKSDHNLNNKHNNYTHLKKFRGGEVEGLSANLFGTGGFWRYAWKLDLENFDYQRGKMDTVVLKTLKYEHNFEDAHFEHDRVDAVAMERLTSSPHVINIFGFCGHSVMTEYADGSRLGALADKSRKKKLERLRIARDIADGLADVHGINGDTNTTFVHLDVNPANVVSVNGTLKLNDFNIGIIRQWNTTSNEACGFPTQYPNPQWRSPEEARNEQHLTEKVDIFSLGHIFFRLICGHEPWNKLEPGGRPSKEVVNDKVQRGVLPFIPDQVRDSSDLEVITIRDVMLDCYSFDPNKRPSARDIAKTLDRTLQNLTLSKLSIASDIKQKRKTK